MKPVRTILNDLVDRRLWPVALALVAALVAVPVMLGGAKSPSTSAEPVANAPATASPASQAAISVSTPPTTPQDRAGAVRNPFVQHKLPPLPGATTPVLPSTGTPVTGTLPPAGGGGGSTIGGANVTPITPGTGTGTGTGTGGTTTVQDIWAATLRFGQPGSQKLHKDVPRLTPLPSATNPFFVFLGVLKDHKTAVFLISSDATATGDGTCKPNPTQCDTVELKAGDTEFFDVAQGNAGVTQYELDVIKVLHTKVTGKAAAAKASKHVSSDGKNVVSELKAEGDKSMDRYIYSYKRGILVRRHASRAVVSASASSTGLSSAHTSSLAGATWGTPVAGQ